LEGKNDKIKNLTDKVTKENSNNKTMLRELKKAHATIDKMRESFGKQIKSMQAQKKKYKETEEKLKAAEGKMKQEQDK
jgi:hypothetical protein